MDPSGEPTRWRCAAGALAPGQTAKLRLEHGGRSLDCFIVNHAGRYYAYVNCCPHAGTTLDLWPNEFLTEDGQFLICATHGAIFGPDTGVCVEGPCPGARLERLVVEIDGETVIVSCPA